MQLTTFRVFNFDADGTLFDTTQAKAKAFVKIWCQVFGSSEEEVMTSYLYRVTHREPGVTTEIFFNQMGIEFLGHALSHEKFTELETAFTQLLKQSLPGLLMIDGAPELLKDLHAAGATMVISTMALHDEITARMNAVPDVAQCFAAIRGGNGLFVKGQPHMQKLIEIAGCEPAEVLVVGDEPKDFVVARDAGTKVALVAQTHDYGVLAALKPDILVRTIAELRPFLLLS